MEFNSQLKKIINNQLLRCKKCNKVREKISLSEIKDADTKKAIATIYDGSQLILNCISCDEISLIFSRSEILNLIS